MKDDNRELALIEKENIDAVAVFTGEQGVERVLDEIETKVRAFEPDLATAKSRKEIASMAYKVSQSKALLDGLGKALVADWKAKAAKVDASRKIARDRLDALRDEVRQPLKEWEEAEEKRKAEEKAQQELLEAEEAAWAAHALWLKEKELQEREAEIAKAEAKRIAWEQEQLHKEQAVQREKERQEAEALRIKEAEERAKQAAEEARIREKQEYEAALARAEEEKQKAVREAEERARLEAERKEADRLFAEAEEQARKEAEAARIEKEKNELQHRRDIHTETHYDLVAWGMEAEPAKDLIRAIVKGNISHLQMVY